MNLFLVFGLTYACATRATAQSSTTSGAIPTRAPTPTDRLLGWFNRTTLIQPQPTELALADFYAGLESAAWRTSAFTALFFQPNLVVDVCGLVHIVAPDDIDIMNLGVDFFNTPEHKSKRWNGDIKISDLATKTLVARLGPGPGSQNIVFSSIYAWPISHMPRIGWYWDWVRWRDERLQEWFGWTTEELRKWPKELDRVINLMGETSTCGDAVYGNRTPGLLKQVQSNPDGAFTRRDGVWSATSSASATHAEL